MTEGHFHGKHHKGYMHTVREIKRSEALERSGKASAPKVTPPAGDAVQTAAPTETCHRPGCCNNEEAEQ